MAIEKTLCCDGRKPNGDPCDTRAPMRGHTPPPGWSTVVRYEKAGPEDISMISAMKPMLDRGREKDPDVADAVDQMTANMLETMPARAVTAMLCPEHELPIAKTHSGESNVVGCY